MRATRQRRKRSHKLIVALALVVALVLIGGGADIGYTAVKSRAAQLQAALTSHLEAGQKDLEAGKASLTQANAKHDVALVTQATTYFAAAKDQFVIAGRLADDSNLLRYLEMVPSYGTVAKSRHTAVSGIAGMGAALADAGQDLAAIDGQLIKPSAPGQAGHSLLTALTEAQTGLTKVRGDLDRAQKAASQVDIRVVPAGQQATFLKAKADIATGLSGFDEFDRLVPVLIDVLGGNGPRTFLIEQVNPAELRAGGGFIGTYSLVRANQGALTVIKSGDAYDLVNPRPLPGQRGFIPQPTPYREVIPDVSWSFVDSNIYPDFPSNARAAISFVEPRLKTSIDAVISMDYYTVTKMLELTGPIAVRGYGTVTATNFIPDLLPDDISGGSSHKAILASIAGPLMQRVASLPPDRWPSLVAALNILVSQRHMQAYFKAASAESELDRVGWSGTMQLAGHADYIMEVESNYYGDKANYYVARRYTIELTRIGSTLLHKVIVALSNSTPCGIYQRTQYRANVRLYVGAGATGLSDNERAVRYANPAPPSGTRLLDGWLPDIYCRGGSAEAVFQYDTPWNPDAAGQQQIYWQKQPGTLIDKVAIVWNDSSGHIFRASGDLGQDRVITLSSAGVVLTAGQPAQATLPSLSLG